jgi:hypothetical protein
MPGTGSSYISRMLTFSQSVAPSLNCPTTHAYRKLIPLHSTSLILTFLIRIFHTSEKEQDSKETQYVRHALSLALRDKEINEHEKTNMLSAWLEAEVHPLFSIPSFLFPLPSSSSIFSLPLLSYLAFFCLLISSLSFLTFLPNPLVVLSLQSPLLSSFSSSLPLSGTASSL